MIGRHAKQNVLRSLAEAPAVAVLGPRQIGKTTLARDIAADVPDSLYLDLEDPRDAARLADPAKYLDAHTDRLVVLDEIQRLPGLFRVLRGQIDQRRRAGRRSGQFLLLGSASDALMRQSSESLAGRVIYDELPGLTVLEVGGGPAAQQLWVRGGFPDAFSAGSDAASARWRTNFIRTYLERDIPQFGVRVPAPMLRRLWTMLGHRQGGLLNASDLGRSLSVSAPAIGRYVDLLVDCGGVHGRLQRPALGALRQPAVHAALPRDVGMVRKWQDRDTLWRTLRDGPWHFVTPLSRRAPSSRSEPPAPRSPAVRVTLAPAAEAAPRAGRCENGGRQGKWSA